MSAETHAFDFYYRTTDANGKVTHHETRVWDKERFIAARQQEAEQENRKAGSTKAGVQQITREQYKESR